MRFDRLVRPAMLVRDVKVRHPECVPIFEKHGFRASCDDCSVEQAARKYGLDPLEIVDELNAAVLAQAGRQRPD